ncbi:adenylosuccinate lyase [bacterium]|nr:adenylosuccinate lyase [bacterium]
MEFSIFDCVSPLDYRYYGDDPKMIELLGPHVTERAYILSELEVEAAAVQVFARRKLCSEAVAEEVAQAIHLVTPEEVHEEDARIHHDTRAMVNCLQRHVSDEAKPFIHLAMTSFDVKDTALALRLKRAAHDAVIPELIKLEKTLIDLARREKDTLQMGRTHGQHAVPITFGFAIAQYVSRLGGRIEAIRAAADNLRGKISGAVGAYNASSLLFDDPLEFEQEVLGELGLEPSPSSTQIVEAEFATDYMHALVSAFGVLANLADDMRHLQRTEIAEVGEKFEANQVGSSTMPHKRNPWNFENVKSLWKVVVARMQTVYLDQISEHQRDLTNSASQRFLPEVIVMLVNSTRRLQRVMGKLVTDPERMAANFAMTHGMIAAEPAYILLAAHGHPDAHEALRKLTLQAQATGRPLGEILREEKDLAPYLEKFTPAQRALLDDPRLYVGRASQKTELLCQKWEQALGL